MGDFSWNLDSDNDRADVVPTPHAPTPPAAATSRRALRATETTSSASRARSVKTPRALKTAPTASARSRRAEPPKARAPKAQSQKPRSQKPQSQKPRSRKPRRADVLRKFITISAMFGAGALLVATSLPAVALHVTSANAFAPAEPGPSTAEVQSLAVDRTAVDAAPTRDPYTVVNTIQQARMKFGLQNFEYTNDTNGTIQWPFPAPVPISSGFGARVSPCGGCSSFHEGVDFVPGAGTPIGAIADGTVTYAAYDGNFGYHVIIDHNINGQKVQSLYAHMLAGSIKVVVGQQVTVTQELGQVGSTGHSTGAHLHLEVHLDGTPVDPFAWLKANAN